MPDTMTVSCSAQQHTGRSSERGGGGSRCAASVQCAAAVWKSSFTFNNLTAVSAMCRATYAFAPLVPSCGAGLKCFPQDSSTYLQFAVFPSCPACPLPINLIA